MISYSRFSLLLAIASGTVRGQAPGRAGLAAKLGSCQLAGFDGGALCGRYEVPEDRSVTGGRRIALNVVVLPATTDSVAADPLMFLAGGGVVPASRYAGFIARAFPELRRSRDIVLVDQRGTWGSNPLVCAPPRGNPGAGPGDSAAVAAANRCRDSLSAVADLRAYNTPAAVEDLEAVRAWLGYDRVNLYGVSYGTKVAQVYVAMHPDRIRAAALYGVVPVFLPSQLDLATSAEQSIAKVFGLCSADVACHVAFPRVEAEFDSVLNRLSRSSEQVVLERPDGTQFPVPVTGRSFRDLVQGMLGSARGAERLPALIHAAFSGDLRPVAVGIVGDGPPPPPGAPRGVFLSLVCSEAIPQFKPEEIAPATQGTFFGDAPVRSQVRLCADWPRAALPKDFWAPVRASVPLLAISGDLDPITPPRYGAAVAANFAGAQHIIVPNRSHNDVDPCITSLFQTFLLLGGAGALDKACVSAPNPLKFATELRPPR